MLVDAIANATLDAYLGATSILPSTVYIGLMTVQPNANGSGVVEPVGNGYARVGVTNNPTNWPAASSRTKSHTGDIVFPTASGTWGTIYYVGIFDAPSGGNLRLYDALSVPRLIINTDIYRFLAGTANALKISF
jgi:hypothetical protein